MKFNHYSTDNQIDIHVCSTEKFKTNLLELFLVRPLREKQETTRTALLPFLFFRGSEQYPTNQKLIRRLEDLYGAGLNISVLKRGENQLLRFSLELTADSYLTEDENLLETGLEFLYQLVFKPLLEDKKFKEEYLNLAKNYVREEIKGIKNDKYNYAMFRCFQEMCSQESFSIHKLGAIECLENINSHSLYQFYQKIIKESPVSLFLLGNFSQDMALKAAEKTFAFPHSCTYSYNQTEIIAEPGEIREVIDKENVHQAKLNLGFRTGITRDSKDYYALMLYSGILGGFPHSILFQSIREESGLAYYVNTRLESTKGLMLINCGIDPSNYKQVREAIREQVDNFSEYIDRKKIKWTRSAIINKLLTLRDNNKSFTGNYLLGWLNKKPESVDKIMEKVKEVSPEEIVKVSEQIKLDTIYLLKGEGK